MNTICKVFTIRNLFAIITINFSQLFAKYNVFNNPIRTTIIAIKIWSLNFVPIIGIEKSSKMRWSKKVILLDSLSQASKYILVVRLKWLNAPTEKLSLFKWQAVRKIFSLFSEVSEKLNAFSRILSTKLEVKCN